MERRTLLALLVGAGASAGALNADTLKDEFEAISSNESRNSKDSQTESDRQSSLPPKRYLHAWASLGDDGEVEMPQIPKSTFNYEAFATDIGSDEPMFKRIEAEPLNDKSGDTIRIEPAVDVGEAVDYLDGILGERSGLTYRLTINGEERQFIGGKSRGYVYLLWGGIHSDSEILLLGRGVDPESAKAAASLFSQ